MAEDRKYVVGLGVARPAFEYPKLPRVVKADVERAVSPLGKAAQCAAGGGSDRSIARVDRADDVSREKGFPRAITVDAVCPFGVGEAAARAKRHHEDRRRNHVFRDELV